MPLTTLDKNTALIVIDLQKGIVGMPTAHPMATVVKHARTLTDAFRRHDLPVVLVNVTGVPRGRVEQPRQLGELPTGWADLIPELDQKPQDHLVTKQTRGAFTGTDLDAYLRQRGVTQVVVVGVATSAGVESTARHAHELGYNVTLATDAMTDRSAEAHAHSLAQIFPRLGETGTTAQVIDLLERRT
jgi:nicotinamidase-related amidase